MLLEKSVCPQLSVCECVCVSVCECECVHMQEECMLGGEPKP